MQEDLDKLDKQKELCRQERYDKISLGEVLDIYNEISSMIKSLEDREKALAESENNGWWNKKDDWLR